MEQAIDRRNSCSRIPARPAPSRHELGSVGSQASLASKAACTCWSPKTCWLAKPMLCQLHRCFALLSRSYVASGGSRLSLPARLPTLPQTALPEFWLLWGCAGHLAAGFGRRKGGATVPPSTCFRIHAPSSLSSLMLHPLDCADRREQRQQRVRSVQQFCKERASNGKGCQVSQVFLAWLAMYTLQFALHTNRTTSHSAETCTVASDCF